VGTQSEVQDLLRLLFVHAGERACSGGHGVLRRMDPRTFVDELLAGAVGERFSLLAARSRPVRGAPALLAELVRQGYRRALDAEGEPLDLEGRRVWPRRLDPLDLVLGRFRAGGSSARLAEAVDEALALQGARVRAVGPG